MSSEEKVLFKKYLYSSESYFEFGCGGSTLWADKCENIKTVVSVEADSVWAANIAKITSDKVRFMPVVFDVGRWSSPTNHTQKNLWEEYSSCIQHTYGQYDLVLLDGRFRTACGVQAYSKLKDSGFMLLHDYREKHIQNCRESYIRLNELYILIELKNTLAVFKKKSDVSAVIFSNLWHEFKHVQE